MVYRSDEAFTPRIIVEPYAGDGSRFYIGEGVSPAWGPDSDELFFFSPRPTWESGSILYAVEIEAEPSFRHSDPIGLFGGAYAALPGIAAFPDGEHFLLATLPVDEYQTEIQVVENLSEVLERRGTLEP